MKDFLSHAEREQLKAQHRRERDKRICYRINAVLLYNAGWTYQEIANALLLNDETVRLHIHEYKESRKLKPENGGSESKLNAQETEQLLQHLQEHTYLFVKNVVAYVEAIHKQIQELVYVPVPVCVCVPAK